MSDLKPYLPDDFDDFWRAISQEVHDAKLDYHRSLTNDYPWPGFAVERIEFRGIRGETLHGWLAYPEGARRLPGFLWVAPYGRESILPNQYGTRKGFTSLSFNFFGLDAFHQETYTPSRGYFAEGAEGPETWIFRTMFQNAALAARVLQAQIEADENRIGAMGLSQGGGMAIWLGAFSPIVKAVCADLPFLSGIQETLSHNIFRYPPKELIDFMESIPLGRERVFNTLAYYDTMNLATRCAVPTQVSFGHRDPSVRPDNARAAYHALPGEKRLVEYDWGHDWHPDMVENNRAWLVEHMG